MDVNWLLCAGQLENIFADLTECGIVLSKLKTEVLPNPIKFILDSVQIISRIESMTKVFLKNANIVLEKFSEGTVTSLSNNIIDESINHDPGGRGPIISTSQRQYLIALGPHQPKLTRYPINLNIYKCKQHSFSSKWYNEYPSIEYSILKDSVYCFVCSLFPHGPDKLYSNAAWITTGVNQWHKMKNCGAKKLGKLEQHFSSTSHKACLSDYYQFMTNSNHINIILNRHNRKEAIQLEQEKDFNKNIVIMLFDIARTLARQGLAFRGDGDESGGNFMQLVKLLSRHNPLMDRWIKETSKRSYKVHYLGPRSQNEFIELLANETRKIIVNEVKKAIIYSVSADTTPDITHEDRLAVCTRYVNNQGKAVERLLEISKGTDKTGLGNILIIDHGHISGNGKPYASKILESPTWLEICKIANDLIITTGTYFFKYLNDICVVQDLENIKICCLGMKVLSYVNKKIEIESPCYYNLDEKLKKYLGFQNRTFDFSLDINTSTMYVPNSNEQYINIEKQCEFRLGRNGQIPLGTIFIGIYSINEIENVFNSFGAIYVANFPKIKFEIINGFLNVTASIGLCFDEYLSNYLGFDYIGNFKKLIPINKTWPRGKEIVLGVEYTEPDIAYTVIGIKKPNLYTNVFLKNFNGVIRSNKVKTLIKGNYSIDQLNSKLPPGIKLQNDKNCITLTSKTDFYMDQNFKLSLGIENMYFLYKHNGDILNNKSLLDVHCNIIEKSFSSINDKCHIEEDLLYNFYYNDDNPYIKTNPIKYIPVNGGFQEIKIDIINQDGKKYDFDDDNFIVYLDLIKE
ncbi:hypothetical protein QTP88_028760 [Uroleucon formosanum]